MYQRDAGRTWTTSMQKAPALVDSRLLDTPFPLSTANAPPQCRNLSVCSIGTEFGGFVGFPLRFADLLPLPRSSRLSSSRRVTRRR